MKCPAAGAQVANTQFTSSPHRCTSYACACSLCRRASLACLSRLQYECSSLATAPLDIFSPLAVCLECALQQGWPHAALPAGLMLDLHTDSAMPSLSGMCSIIWVSLTGASKPHLWWLQGAHGITSESHSPQLSHVCCKAAAQAATCTSAMLCLLQPMVK